MNVQIPFTSFQARNCHNALRHQFTQTSVPDWCSSCFLQYLWGPRRAVKHLQSRRATLAAGGYHRGDLKELHLFLLLHSLLHGSLRCLQGPCRQCWVWFWPQLLINDPQVPWKDLNIADTHTKEDQSGNRWSYRNIFLLENVRCRSKRCNFHHHLWSQ